MLGSRAWQAYRDYLKSKVSEEQGQAFNRSPLTPEGQEAILVGKGRASAFTQLAEAKMTTKESELMKFVTREMKHDRPDRTV